MDKMDGLGLLGMLFVTYRFGPHLLELILAVGVFAVGRRGDGPGWRLIAIAGALSALATLSYGYPLYVMMTGGRGGGDVRSIMNVYSAVSTILRIAQGALLLAGLVQIQGRAPAAPASAGQR